MRVSPAALQSVKIPFPTDYAHLAFAHGTPILATTNGPSITKPVVYTYRVGNTWKPFKAVTGTWASGRDFDMITTAAGVRLITGNGTTNLYASMIAKWTGHGVLPRGEQRRSQPRCRAMTAQPMRVTGWSTSPRRTAGWRCPTSRLPAVVPASWVCPCTASSPVSSRRSRPPTRPRRRRLGGRDGYDHARRQALIQPLLLAGVHHSVTKHGRHGSVTLTGPATCLPASSLAVAVKGHGKHGWTVRSRKSRWPATRSARRSTARRCSRAGRTPSRAPSSSATALPAPRWQRW